jgi:hypothetical protein
MDAVTCENQLVTDLPPHILRLARMMARDCAAPGQYVIHLIIPAYKTESVSIETARVDMIRRAEVARRYVAE